MPNDALSRSGGSIPTRWMAVAVAVALTGLVGCPPPRAPSPPRPKAPVAPPVVCRIDSVSDEVVEGGELEVIVSCTLPPGRKPTQLNCELKGTGPEVLRAHRRMVRGRGRHRFVFGLPSRGQATRLKAYVWLGTDWRRPVVPIVASKPIVWISRETLSRRKQAETEAPKVLAKLAHKRGAKGNVALLAGDWPGQQLSVIDALDSALRAGGYAVTRLDSQAFLNPYVVSPDRFDLLIVTGAGGLPVESAETLSRYLRNGGNLMALGTPLFSDPVRRVADRWMTASQTRAELDKTPTSKMLLDFETGDLTAWTRSSDDPKSPTTYTIVNGGADGSRRCMHVKIANLSGWETIYSPALPTGAVPVKHALTCFRARGGPGTRSLAVEWNERDGSRWIGTIPLTTQWRYYVLTPDSFPYWRDSPSKGRGGPGDRFKPENVGRIGFGLAFTHTGHMGGAHEFWVDQIGMAVDSLGDIAESGPPEFAATDLLWPSYKYYRANDVGAVRPNPMQALVATRSLPLPRMLRCPHQRPQGTGFDKGRDWRMITVAEAVSPSGDFRGPALSVMVNQPQDGRANVWAAVGVDDVSFLKAPRTVAALAGVTERVIDGVFLLEGGSEFYTVFQRESIRLGARVVNCRREGQRAIGVRVRVLAGGAEAFAQVFAGTVRAGGPPAVFDCTWGPDRLNPDGYTVVVELTREGRIVDRVRHELGVWQPKPNPQFVTARNGDFYLADKKWVPFGVNHMPSSGIGIEDGDYFEQYLGKRAYDPEIFDRELARIKALGMNMVSEFLHHRSHAGRNLIDLLRRCDKYGIKVNLSLRPGTPMDFEWDKMRQMIVENRLAENDTVFAYDLAWEPFVGNQAQRARWDKQWGEWVQRRYGAIDLAERAWGFKAPRNQQGFLTNPLDKHCGGDGPWRKMVCDYRRFIDELAHKYYAEARRLVRTVDKHHLVSFRMTVAGDPTFDQAHRMPFDFRSLRNAVDLFEPEGYGRIGDWQRVRPGLFTVAYARAVDPTKPVMWAEYGVSSWDSNKMATNPASLAFEAKFYDDFLKMVHQSGANGAVCWWYPGGFRVGENSDFGIINPDGTDRPVAAVLRKYAELITTPGERPKPNVWIDYNPEDPAGIQGIYQQVGDQFWKAIDAGKTPGLRAVKK